MNEDTDTIPMDWVEGPDETTVWLWPNTADPVTIMLDRAEWDELKARQERSEYQSMDRLIGEAVADDLSDG